jgi:hypothetical protein
VFGRGRKRSDPAGEESESAQSDEISGADVERDGPFDVDEAPDDGVHRLDLGALRVPALNGVQVQFQVEEASGKPITVVVTDGRSAMEISVFAAPKSSGLWDDVRAEILETVRSSGGSEGEGEYGPELRMRLPTARPGESVPGRMIGIDGPRWFLRAVVTGPAGQEPGAGPLLDETLRRLVVVRGDSAMPVRDPLPLRLPKEVVDHPDGPGAQDTTQSGRPEMPAPGVRISETR